MKDTLIDWLETLDLQNTELAYFLIIIGIIALTSLIIHFILHRVVIRLISHRASQSQRLWQRALFQNKLFSRLALTLQGFIVYTQARIWLDSDTDTLVVIEVVTHLWVLLYALLSLFALLDTLEDIVLSTPYGRRFPLRGIFQSIKLISALVTIIFAISLLIGKSPVILFSSLGAMTAVLLLIFKDPIMGLVAGIQLSANDMLAVGDWLEMPKYGADGDVIDISLTTVKVRNWDKTITTIPAYSLISDSFKNWRGMTEAGGRRIKRAVNIDATSVRFLDEAALKRLRRAQLLTDYIENKVRELTEYNKENNIDPESPVNGRKLTNLGTFRAYLTAYLRAHKKIHQENMTLMVRQLEPGANGIPMEIYAFSNDINWVAYEGIQADIFDHVFAVIPEFGLRIHQTPTGYDLQQIGVKITDTTTTTE
ncbi:mechanosensitive ion channel family protein [Cellvibrio sp. PSBB006]|uniref:mechanosensitive ion channel family protein n=1 Tax=Cellvibrio sp. PSBB006 TaxID=1987723 RepID=UPI000B3B763D|nr:mechanosensitive ion channel family protein [Cellvibrio sp. PSBB006]ARU28531.1 miniconductance mechanosensitive channel [Cellvibrio sp. PSBB006]